MKNLISNRIYNLIKKLYPITRSLTGNGNRETLSIINDIIPIETFEVPSGTKAFDWEVPKEWNIKNAYIKDTKGNKIAEVSKADRWRDVLLSGVFDFSDTYAVHILDSTYDKRIILGLVIAIDNSVHDK